MASSYLRDELRASQWQREYVLAPYARDDFALIEAYRVRRRRDGSLDGVEWVGIADIGDESDSLDRRLTELAARQGDGERLRLDDEGGREALEALLDSRRFYLHNVDGLALRMGDARAVRFDWRALAGRAPRYRLVWLALDPAQGFERLLALAPPHYLDLSHGLVGPLDTGLPVELAVRAAAQAPLDVDAAERLRAELVQWSPAPPPPLTAALADAFAPVPRLTLGSLRERVFQPRSGRMTLRQRHRAALAFDYGGTLAFGETPKALVVERDQRRWQVTRRFETERAAQRELAAWGLKRAARRSDALSSASGDAFEMSGERGWLKFVREALPKLRDSGWEVVIQPDFAFDLTPIDAWFFDFDPEAAHFEVVFGVRAGGYRIDLRAALARAILRAPQRFSPQTLAAGGEEAALVLELPAEADRPSLRLALPHARLEALLSAFEELRFDPAAFAEGEPLRWSRLELARLAPFASDAYEWPAKVSLDALGSLDAVPLDQPPQGLQATLRGYQREGLAWLRGLDRIHAGGLLADDMGLGKTLQVIAFLLGEFETERLDRPALVIAPTSLLANWEDELARFAPSLAVLTLHGGGRRALHQEIDRHQVVLTSYPLLARDVELLEQRSWRVLVCDEAQMLKNPSSRTALAARRLKADLRLCLSGTPVENHLGELWSQFELLMPGWLDDASGFTRRYRQPIEGRGDRARLELLLARLRPYLLRRTKEEVAADLPGKSEIVVRVELEGRQRERYEEVRRSMLARVEEAVAARGLSGSRMVVLEALLRLRQVSCDARLLEPKAERGLRPVTVGGDSAKLVTLLEMLAPMLEAGRRVLLFSQFTSVLALIQRELERRGWRYLLLTGESRDRREPVRAFQAGEAPLFLISLKAGGAGLNLTAADTVIHFDPWWNPAVENQAIDRAHRIGQDKPVFVYRLIARGTVEERIQSIQRRKAALSDTLLEGERGLDWSFDHTTLHELFAPLD